MKITPHPEKTFGATITNIKVSNITTSQFQQIEDAFNQYGLLIFKNQHLSMSEQTEFGKRFGEIEHLVQTFFQTVKLKMWLKISFVSCELKMWIEIS